jgi:uncharacterized protein (UPF0332 family)
VKAESATFLQQAQVILGRAERMLAAQLHEDAARAAYLACYHVAQALIFEHTGRALKSHNGVQSEFNRLLKGQSGVDDALRRFLSQSYEFKSVADYGTGPDAVVSASAAEAAVATGKCFVAHFADIIAASSPTAS